MSSTSLLGGCVPLAEPEGPDAELAAEGVEADWNSERVQWRPYQAGLDEAQASGKPIVLVFYTNWCPHCHNYSRVFHDPELVELAGQFVMVRVERDSNPELSAQYDIDGQYIPRTFFLGADGVVKRELNAGAGRYRYFLDEYRSAQLLGLMRRALLPSR